MEYSVYVISSDIGKVRYVGMTSKDVKERLKTHNQGGSTFTSRHKDWKLIYFEKGYCKQCATRRERFLKSGQGRGIIDLLAGKH